MAPTRPSIQGQGPLKSPVTGSGEMPTPNQATRIQSGDLGYGKESSMFGRAGTRGASDADPEEQPRDGEKLSPSDIIGTSGSSHA